MIYGIGVDILSTNRLEDLRGKYDDSFFRKTFSEKEYEAGVKRTDPIKYFSGRFAAKEAVFKALDIDSGAFRFSEIETLNNGSGKPYVVLYGRVKQFCEDKGIKRLHISLSNDKGYVTAFVICET